jgi:hypothetical protein
MPDPNYQDPTGQIPAYQQYQMPDPSQQMMNYSYLQNNQMLMNTGQSNIQRTIQTVQYNFHRDLQNILQGTMAAGMAVYNTGKSVTDKARERQYQDQLLGQGNYVIERNFWREALWGMGIAGSDIGRALKIGGRRPEYMSQEELQMQLGRSWHHRMEELGVAAGGGGIASVTSLAAMGLTKSMGLVKGSLVGLALDQTVGRFYDVAIADPREYRRNFRTMTEVTDANYGAGQRRMTGISSDQLMDRFYENERNPYGTRYIPFVGGMIADRLAPDTKASEFIPKMMQAGLFRDQNLKDIDKMEKFVKDTIQVVERFAGLANTTKDAILGLKANLNQMGLNDLQQNTAISNIVATSRSTGLDVSTVANYQGAFMQMGFNAHYNKDVVGQSGLNELASIKALQEAGFIDKSLDAGSLSMRNTQNAINQSKTGWGTLNRFGGDKANIGATRAYFANNGGGSDAVGYAADAFGLVGNSSIDPNANFAKSARNAYQKYLDDGQSKSQAYISAAASMQLDGSPEAAAQFNAAILGEDKTGKMLSAATIARREADRTGDKTKIIGFNLNDVKPGNTLFSGELSLGIESIYKRIQSAKGYDRGSKEADRFSGFKNQNQDSLKEMYKALLNGDLSKAEKIKESIINNSTGGSGTANSYSYKDAELAIDNALKEFETNGNGVVSFSDRLPFITNPFISTRRINEAKGVGSLTLKEAVANAGNNDPRNFGKLISGKDYTEVSDNIKDIFSKFINNTNNKEWSKYLYQNAGNRNRNIKLIENIIKSGGDFGISDKEEIQLLNYVKGNGDNALAGLFSEMSKSSDNQSNYGMRNSFMNIKMKGGEFATDFKTYSDRNDWARKGIAELRGMNSAQALKYLKEQGGNLGYNLGAVSGDKAWGQSMIQALEIRAGLGDKSWSEYINKDWFKNPIITADTDSVNKAVGIEGANPNTEAVKSLTLACNRLADAIGK